MVMMSLGRLLLAIQFLTCLSLTPTSPAKAAFFHGSPCFSDPGGRVPRRKCQSSKSPKLNPVGGSSTSSEAMMGPFPKISIERKTVSGRLVFPALRRQPAGAKPAATEHYHGRPRMTAPPLLRSVKSRTFQANVIAVKGSSAAGVLDRDKYSGLTKSC